MKWRNLQFKRMRLKTATRNFAFFAEFGTIAIVEITLNKEAENQMPIALWYYFAISTTLLSAFHLFAVLISSCLLPHIDKSCTDKVMTTTSFRDSPHVKMSPLIFLAWICTNVIRLIMFFLQLIAIVWFKCWEVGMKKRSLWETNCSCSFSIPSSILFHIHSHPVPNQTSIRTT